MKAYIITLVNLDKSVSAANDCLNSAKNNGVNAEIFQAVTAETAIEELNKNNLKFNLTLPQRKHRLLPTIACFLSHYKLWELTYNSNQPSIVLEHDSIIVSNIPKLSGDIVNLGKPSWGHTGNLDFEGERPLSSGEVFLGAHGYYITPLGASNLLDVAKSMGGTQADCFFNKSTFGTMLREYHPWPIIANSTFTTVQASNVQPGVYYTSGKYLTVV